MVKENKYKVEEIEHDKEIEEEQPIIKNALNILLRSSPMSNSLKEKLMKIPKILQKFQIIYNQIRIYSRRIEYH